MSQVLHGCAATTLAPTPEGAPPCQRSDRVRGNRTVFVNSTKNFRRWR